MFQFVLWGGKTPKEALAAVDDGDAGRGVSAGASHLADRLRQYGRRDAARAGSPAADRAGAVDVVNRSDRDLPGGVRQARTLPDGPPPDTVMLAMKPQQLDEIVASARRGDRQGAGADVDPGRGRGSDAWPSVFPASQIVRAMPNLPVALGKGVVVLTREPRRRLAEDAVAALMAPLGLVEWTDDEAMYGAVGTLEGCGPAFLFRFIDALAKAGEALGMPADQAARLALATVDGAAAMAAGSDAIARDARRPRRQPGRIDPRRGSTCSTATMRW